MVGSLRVLGTILPNVLVVVQRFPVSVCIAVFLTGFLMFGVYQGREVDYVSYALLTLFFASLGASLVAERYDFGGLNGVLLSLGTCVFLGTLYFLPEDMYLTPFMMPVGFALIASTAAFIGRGAENRSYWMFNHTYWFGLVVALLGSLLIAGLVSLLIATYGLLFDVNVGSKIYQYSFIVCLFLVGPLFWLSLLPHSFSDEVVEGEPVEFTSKITALFVKYVFVPFFLLFALLFHGLAIKVLFEGSLPAGQVGWYGFALVTAGIVTYLMAFPTREVGGPLVKFFTKYWMWCLLVPLGLIGAAYYLRLDQYGMTPLRFYLFGFLVWAGLLVGYALLMKWWGRGFDLRSIALLAGVIIVLASAGPWGAEAVSNVWQKQRLITDLSTLGVLKDGTISDGLPVRRAGQAALVNRVNGGLAYFRKRNRGELLATLLNEDDLKAVAEAREDGQRFQGRQNRVFLAVKNALHPNAGTVKKPILSGRSFTYRVLQPMGLPVRRAGALYGPFYHHFSRQVEKSGQASIDKQMQITLHTPDGVKQVDLKFDGKFFSIGQAKNEWGRFELEEFHKLALKHQALEAGEKMHVEEIAGQGRGQKLQAHMLVNSLTYRTIDAQSKAPQRTKRVEMTGVGFWLFVGQ